jgi:rod shape determining protein RodA
VRVARSLAQTVYWPLVVPAALLLLFGLLTLGGLEIRVSTGWLDDLHVQQLTGIAVGLAAAAVVLLVPYKELVARAYVFYALNLVLLVVVLMAGEERKEARRWLSFGGFVFQPSELMKLTLVLTLARFIRFRSSYKTFKGLGSPFLLTLVPMGLILKQPDLGTALLFIPILFTMLFLAGARPRHLLTIIVLGACAIYPVYEWGLHDYQKRRIDGFLVQLSIKTPTDKEAKEMERKELYQVQRAKVAIGAGGWNGADETQAEAQSLYRVPERHNDFVFAAVGSRWGFLGGIALVGLFLWFLLVILRAAMRQRDPAGRLICVGIFALFGFQAFINLAMNVGLMPVTGLTLPFLSHGRSSIVVSILAVALVCNVASRPSYEFGRGDFD